MSVPSNPQDLINLIREKLFNNTSGLIEEPDLREVLEYIVKVLDAKFSFFAPNLTEEQFSKWNLILDYMVNETQGVLLPSSPAPTQKGKYLLSTPGTYANLGGLVADTGKWNYAYFDGTTWSKIEVEMPENNVKIPKWEDLTFPVTGYLQTVYQSTIYELPQGVTAQSGDVPSPTSTVWSIIGENTFVTNNYTANPAQLIPIELLYDDVEETPALTTYKRVSEVQGVDVNYLEVTDWYDGTPMTDARVDGYIFKKIDGKFVQRQIDRNVNLKVDTVADLRLFNGYYEGQEISLLGYYTSGDKQPLTYKFTAFQGVDDGGSVINSSKGSWIAQFVNDFNIKDFGAKHDNSDEWEVLKKSLKFASKTKLKLKILEDIKIDTSPVDASRTVFINDNVHVIGNGNDILINNTLSNSFIIALSENISFKNINFQYYGRYDPTNPGTTSNGPNQAVKKAWLKANKPSIWNPITSDPAWQGPVAYMAVFQLAGAKNVTFDNVKFYTKSNKPQEFIVWAIKIQQEKVLNDIVGDPDYYKTFRESSDIFLNNVTFDGIIMGVQGQVNGFYANGITSLRYSNVQTDEGLHYGGTGNWMPPAHLFYLNAISNLVNKNIHINNVIDKGIYVGVNNISDYSGGYCSSLKIADLFNSNINNYTSFRRDGLLDLGNINNTTITNLYGEYDSSIFAPTSFFRGVRDVMTNDSSNNVIDNITIKDIAQDSQFYPLNGFLKLKNSVATNINLILNNYVGNESFYINTGSGNNNHITSNLNMNSFNNSSVSIGLIGLSDADRLISKNNIYEFKVQGWRSLLPDFDGYKPRLMVSSHSNPFNNNKVTVIDSSNKMTTEQNGSFKKETIIFDYVLTADSTKNIVTGVRTVDIPAGFTLKKLIAVTTQNFSNENGTTSLKLVTSVSPEQLVTTLPLSGNSVKVLDINVPAVTKLYLVSVGGNFGAQGSVKISIEMERFQVGG